MSLASEHSNPASTALVDRRNGRHREATSESLQARYRQLYAPVAQELAAVDDILRAELVSRYEHVNDLLQHGIRLGGKRLRPALLLLTARACGHVEEAHLLLAAVLEMIHTATLVHDDVLDEATMRRHQATVNARAGNEASVLLGDFLFSHSFYLASTLDNTFACQRIGRTTNIVCEGEMRQIHSRGNYGLGEQEYLEIIDAKTAALCACCCELGAHYAGADRETQSDLRQYGRDLGIAFQIVDDLLDVVGDEARIGKSLGTDLAQEKMTLPMIRLLDVVDAEDRSRIMKLKRLPASERQATLRRYLEETDALPYARHRALQYAAAARGRLECLPDSEARQVLSALTEFVVVRGN